MFGIVDFASISNAREAGIFGHSRYFYSPKFQTLQSQPITVEKPILPYIKLPGNKHVQKIERDRGASDPKTQHMVRCIIGSLYRTDMELHRLRNQMVETSKEQQ